MTTAKKEIRGPRRKNPTPANVIGQRVREQRFAREYSQAQLAELVQKEISQYYPDLPYVLDQSDISRIESGTRPVWDYELKALAVALSVSTDYLLGLVNAEGELVNQGSDDDDPSQAEAKA